MNLEKNSWEMGYAIQPLSEAFLYASPEGVDEMSFVCGESGLQQAGSQSEQIEGEQTNGH